MYRGRVLIPVSPSLFSLDGNPYEHFPEEAADRLALRELVDAYAHCADRRDAKGQMALFTEDAHFVVYMDAKSDIPSQDLQGRDALAPVFDNLNQYEATT